MDMYASGMTSTKKSCRKAIDEASRKTTLNQFVIKVMYTIWRVDWAITYRPINMYKNSLNILCT